MTDGAYSFVFSDPGIFLGSLYILWKNSRTKGFLTSPSPIINSLCPGACRSDLGRQYHDKGWLYTVGMAVFFGALSKSTADGARTLVLSTLTTPEENGKYIKHYGSEEEYERYVLPFSPYHKVH